MITIILLFVLFILAGFFKGRMDAIADEGLKQADWPRKYNLTKKYKKHWWYLGLHNPKYPERFPFSSTSLVFLTDRWHLNQFFMLRCFYMTVAVIISANVFTFLLLSFVVLPIVVGVSFEIFYNSYREKFGGKNKIYYYPLSGDEPNDNIQVTSVPEKQIGDE